jgi:hypothetical protein
MLIREEAWDWAGDEVDLDELCWSLALAAVIGAEV